MTEPAQLTTDAGEPGVWRVTFDNPPINLFAPSTILELQALVERADNDPGVKVLLFESADPDFFIAHFDASDPAASERTLGGEGRSPWAEVVQRLNVSPVVSIAKIRGRARGIGSEFALACDLRFASRERALFSNPEIGVGLLPGGGALEWLPRLVGRSRALEIALSGDDFDADLAERYGWINRAFPDAELDGAVDGLARRLASFDRAGLGAVKTQVNRVGLPSAAEFESTSQMFWDMLKQPNAAARRAKFRTLGYGARSDFELNFGRRVAELGG